MCNLVQSGVEFCVDEVRRSVELITCSLSEIDEAIVVGMEMLWFTPGDGVGRGSKSQAFC